jgi:hypothetical protein
MYNPTMSVSFSSNRMSLETLKVLLKWGLRPWLRQMREIVAALAPASLAMVRVLPLHWRPPIENCLSFVE